MSKSTAPLIPGAQQGIPFAASSAPIREAHRAQKALPVRLPISSTLRNPQKQRSLQRHELMHTDTRICASQGRPLYKNSTHLPQSRISVRLTGLVILFRAGCRLELLYAAHLPKSPKRLSPPRYPRHSGILRIILCE
jgi:hypothetical protein